MKVTCRLLLLQHVLMKFYLRECQSSKVSLMELRYQVSSIKICEKLQSITDQKGNISKLYKAPAQQLSLQNCRICCIPMRGCSGWMCVVACSFLCLHFCTSKALALNLLSEQSTKINSYSMNRVNCVGCPCPFAKKLSHDEECWLVLAVTEQSFLQDQPRILKCCFQVW